MSDTDLTAEEQKYFDTGGEEAPEVEDVVEPVEPVGSEDKAEEPVEDSKAEEPKEDKPEKVVPYGALHEERMRRKELQEKLEAEAEKRAKMESRFEEFQKRFQPPTEEVPDFNEDPASNLKHEIGKTQKDVEEFRQWKQQQEQLTQRTAQEHEFRSAYKAQADEFAAAKPDFADAYKHWYADVMEELKEAGYTEPADIRAQAEQFERNIAMKALQDKVNPAERLYNLARKRGYKAQASKPALEGIEKGQKAAKSLSGGGGEAPRKTTLESLSQLDDDEFEKIAGDPKAWAKLWQ